MKEKMTKKAYNITLKPDLTKFVEQKRKQLAQKTGMDVSDVNVFRAILTEAIEREPKRASQPPRYLS